MPVLEEDVTQRMQRAIGLRSPGKKAAPEFARARKLRPVMDDGLIPNHPRFVTYRNAAVGLLVDHDPVALTEDLFEANGWGDTCRGGIYDYVHYHSRILEVLGIARGKGRRRFGGSKARTFTVKADDVVILPAETGHQCLAADDDFLVVGACRRKVEDCPRALNNFPKVPAHRRAQVYGKSGAPAKLWKTQK